MIIITGANASKVLLFCSTTKNKKIKFATRSLPSIHGDSGDWGEKLVTEVILKKPVIVVAPLGQQQQARKDSVIGTERQLTISNCSPWKPCKWSKSTAVTILASALDLKRLLQSDIYNAWTEDRVSWPRTLEAVTTGAREHETSSGFSVSSVEFSEFGEYIPATLYSNKYNTWFQISVRRIVVTKAFEWFHESF